MTDSLGQNKKIGLGACVAYRGGLEYQAMFRYDHIKISGWHDANGKFGSALTLDFSRVYSVMSWRQDQILANFISIKIGRNNDYQIIFDNGYDLKNHKLACSESGVLKTFESPVFLNTFCMSGFIGLTYKYEDKTINAYLFVHL